MNIAHRDLKPENFLFMSNDPLSDIKLIDFGLSKICSEGRLQRMNTRAGTPFYIAPEVLNGNFDLSADMWSAGCILYILLCGYPPFFGDNNQEILRMVARGVFDFDGEEWDNVCNEAKDLIKKLLCKSSKRITAAEALSHPYIRAHNKHTDEEKLRSALQGLNLGNLKQFQKSEKIKKIALMAIAVQLDPEEVKELKTIFQALDLNGDGFISIEELQTGLGYREDYETLVQILRAADIDQNGSLNYTEFLAASMDATTFLKESYIKTAFMMFDKDNSGQINANELISILSCENTRQNYDYRELEEAIAEVDCNGDGEIDFQEFRSMMHGLAC